MFWKKENNNTKDTEKKKSEKVTTDNILEVFSKDMMKEKQKELSETISDANPLVYLSKASNILKGGFFIVLFFAGVLSTYSYIQNNENLTDEGMLSPVCFLFLGSSNAQIYEGCGSVSAALNRYDGKLQSVKSTQSAKILSMLGEVYALDNFLFTEDISFLLDKSSSKLPVLSMLTEFNTLKDAFEPTKKVYAIDCTDIQISNDRTMRMTCRSFSSDWSDSNITGFNGQTTSKKISGTSITVASSFINFLKKKSQSFQVVDTTKTLNYSDSVEEGKERYTRMTEFEITLKYVNPSVN